jgi:threonine dehydratase
LTTRTAPTLADIRAARERIAGVASVTPVFASETFSRVTGRNVLLKAENLQRTGSFKIRGAVNKIATLTDAERAAGVVAATAGNHGQAVAWAAREAGVPATIFMGRDSPTAKVEATLTYGGEVELDCDSLEHAFELAQAYAAETGATFVHAFEDEAVIAGQGTIGLELAEQAPEADLVVLPIGGGGLASGISIVLRELLPGARLVGVQAANCAPLAGEGIRGVTIAEGIAVKQPGDLTSSILRELLDDIVTVTDEEIAEVMVLLAERAKLVVEGAGAAALAALVSGRVGSADGEGGTALALLSGGNIDPTLLIQVMRHGLTVAGRYLALRTRVPDRPGELNKLLQLVAEQRANIVEVEHRREGVSLSIVETEVELTLALRDQEHATALIAALESAGYPVERLS